MHLGCRAAYRYLPVARQHANLHAAWQPHLEVGARVAIVAPLARRMNPFGVALSAFEDRADRHVIAIPHRRYAKLGRILTVLATDDLGTVPRALGDTDVAVNGVHAQPRAGGHAVPKRE